MNYWPKIVVFFFFLWTFSTSLIALDASVTHASYLADGKSFTEFYFHFVGNTVKFDSSENGLKAGVYITMIITENDSIIDGDRFLINSPWLVKHEDFVHLYRRVIKNGNYLARFELVDHNDSLNTYTILYPFIVDFPSHNISASDIRLLASFKQDGGESNLHRNGIYLEPLPYNLYHKRFNTLSFYFEMYNANKFLKDDFILVFGIQKDEKGAGRAYLTKNVKKYTPKVVNILLASQDLSNVPSGNYYFTLDAINRRGNTLLSRETYFMRSNPAYDVKLQSEEELAGLTYLEKFSDDQIDYYLKSLVPIVSNQDVESINYLLDKGKTDFKKNFIYRFFEKTYPANPSQSFDQYAEVARAIDKMFNDGFGYGFESPRGRIYLKYGKPSDRIKVEDDAGAFPYEIWYFNSIAQTNQRDVRFLFYNPNYTSNGFKLLTSTCRGERQNRQWELELYRNAPGDITDNRVDATKIKSDYRRRARELYTD